MKIVDSVKKFFNFEKRQTSQVIELNKDDEKLLEWLGISPSTISVKGKNALKVATVFACIKILSESVSKLPLKIYQEDEYGIQRGTKHYLNNLLRLRPNPYMSSMNFFGSLEAQKNLYGNSYANIEFDRKGKVQALWPIDASKVTVYIDDVGLLNSKTKMWYVVNTGGQQRVLKPEEILHFKNGITLDGLVGVPIMEYLKSTLENSASADKFINNFYKQGLQVKGLVQYVGDLNEDAKKVFRENFESMSSGLQNSHRIALMPVGYQFQPISLNMSDAQFLENTELTIRQIATAFGIKMHQLNDLSKATLNNIEQQQQQFYTDTLQATLTMYEQEMTYKLFLDSELDKGFYSKFNVDAILRADIKTRYEAYRTGIQGGFLKPNEARSKEDLPPEAGGDRLLVNGNMLPIDMAGQAYLKGGDTNGEVSKEGNEGN
ncbi:phage portal protein [Bacillus anthracis]|uniref:phage portal protein n=1 Tax=Bacillus anthracis TaxID=1392 RepID=UPI001ADEEEDB|nr:phage portal protein [Bacillus anthracis]MBP0784189.1 phage portal protein [Bacillus anthracis]HDR5665633.1 phage portal protein [Bacillus anthracis]